MYILVLIGKALVLKIGQILKETCTNNYNSNIGMIPENVYQTYWKIICTQQYLPIEWLYILVLFLF